MYFLFASIELKTEYSRNDIRVQNLLHELKRLEILAKFKQYKIDALSKCHVNCNPNADVICTDTLKELDTDENSELVKHNNTLSAK